MRTIHTASCAIVTLHLFWARAPAATPDVAGLSDEQLIELNLVVFRSIHCPAPDLERWQEAILATEGADRPRAIESARRDLYWALRAISAGQIAENERPKVDAELARLRLPPVVDLVNEFRQGYRAVFQRGTIETDEEFDLVMRLNESTPAELTDAERQAAPGMLAAYASRRNAETPPHDASAAVEALNKTIMWRTAPTGELYGRDEVDPLIWPDSSFLRSGESRRRLLVALDVVNHLDRDEVRRCRPAQRALVQNRVWTIFDHVAGDPLLRTELARAMVTLALDDVEIAAIADPLIEAVNSTRWPDQPNDAGGPDSYLPRDLRSKNGNWVSLGARGPDPVAKVHVQQFGGRSLFTVLTRFPDGDASPADYFKAVLEFPTPWVPGEEFPGGQFRLNPELPTLPEGTQFALVRRLAVVDRQGRWRSTPLTLSVQLRFYHVTRREAVDSKRHANAQSFVEFLLETDAVAAGGPAHLRAVAPGEKRFMFFFAHRYDRVGGSGEDLKGLSTGPNDVPMQHCANCHAGYGLGSVNSLVGFIERPPAALRLEVGAYDPAESWKSHQYEWGLLQALWPHRAVPSLTN